VVHARSCSQFVSIANQKKRDALFTRLRRGARRDLSKTFLRRSGDKACSLATNGKLRGACSGAHLLQT